MNKVENVNGLEKTGESRIDELKKQIFAQRSKMLELCKTGSTTRNDIYDILLQVSKDHRIENVDDVCDFMDEIEERFGLASEEDTEVSRLYSEIIREYYGIRRTKKDEKSDEHDIKGVTVKFPNSDEDIFNNQDAKLEDVISAAEERLELYKNLISRVEKSNETHGRLLIRLKELQKFYDELAEKYDTSGTKHPRIEDYQVRIER